APGCPPAGVPGAVPLAAGGVPAGGALTAGAAQSAGQAATAVDASPALELQLSSGSVNQGQTFSIRLTAVDDKGLNGMWWRANGTGDAGLSDTHSFDCTGATPCANTWEVTPSQAGAITIRAQALDIAGQPSDEATTQVQVGPSSGSTTYSGATATPTPGQSTTPGPTSTPGGASPSGGNSTSNAG